MSPDKNKPDATWQGPSLHWEEPANEGMMPLSYEQDEAEEVNSDPLVGAPGEVEGPEQLQGFSLWFERLKQIGQHIPSIITPLLFGGITFLFLLPLMRSGQFYLHADRLGPAVLVIIAVMILQGMLLYYADMNNVYWTLSIVGGFCLFLLVGCFALFGPFPTLFLVVVLLIAGTIAARFTKHKVNEGSVEIVYAFGKYSRTLDPGLNFMLPWEKVTAQLQTKERTWICPEQMAHISPNDDVHLKAMICYQLMPEDAHLALIQVEKWEESLQELFKSVLQSAVTHLTPDDFYAWPGRSSSLPSNDGGLRLSNPEIEGASHWAHINLLLKQQMRDRVAPWGVQMNWVHIRDITLTPGAATQIITDPNIAWNTMSAPATPTPPVMSNQAFPFSSAGRATTPPIMGNQAQAFPTSSAGRATTPPVMGNQAPPLVLKGTAEPRQAAPGAKLPKEETLTGAYIQIKNGVITSPDTIRTIAAGFQAIANDPVASNNASFDAARAAQSLYERARLIENQTNTPPPLSVGSAYRDETPTSSGWSIRTPSDDILPAGS